MCRCGKESGEKLWCEQWDEESVVSRQSEVNLWGREYEERTGCKLRLWSGEVEAKLWGG